MRTRRFNWILLLVAGVACLAVGILGVLTEHAAATIVWFAFGLALLVGSLVLRRMRLP